MRVKQCAESPKYNMSKIESSEMASSLKELQIDDERELSLYHTYLHTTYQTTCKMSSKSAKIRYKLNE